MLFNGYNFALSGAEQVVSFHYYVGCSMIEGLHHFARRSSNVPGDCAALARTGSPTLFSARFAGGVAMAYVDTRAALGCMTELIADDPGIDAMLARMTDDARDWDGRDPVRRF